MSTLNESLVVGEFQYGFELEAYIGSIAMILQTNIINMMKSKTNIH